MGPLRVGLVGIENSHVDHILRHLHESDAPPLRVSAMVAGEPERTRALAAGGRVERVVDDVRELHGEVDALIVATRDGATHRALAVPFLRAGIPVWVDKPLATTVDDADAILAAAEAGGALLTSSSTLRWAPDTVAVAAALPSLGPLRSVTVSGPADEGSPYGGLFFTGIHLADIAQRLVPGAPEGVEVVDRDHGFAARYRVGDVAVTLDIVRPRDDVPYRVSVSGAEGGVDREIVVGADYVRPGLRAFADMLATGVAPVPAAEMRAAVAVLAEVERVRHPGR